ncbi:MAG: hypothetical protein IKE43_04755 [Coriobacteriales bacterium]|nr:hypothetical protein [Coriobacteriales bacterium]
MSVFTDLPRNEKGIVECWTLRGCYNLEGLTDNMSEECPHARDDCYSPCPPDCKYAAGCSNPWHVVAHDINLILDETIDRLGAIKKTCYMCEHFLKHGPRIGEIEHPLIPEQATKESSKEVTLHLF